MSNIAAQLGQRWVACMEAMYKDATQTCHQATDLIMGV